MSIWREMTEGLKTVEIIGSMMFLGGVLLVALGWLLMHATQLGWTSK